MTGPVIFISGQLEEEEEEENHNSCLSILLYDMHIIHIDTKNRSIALTAAVKI